MRGPAVEPLGQADLSHFGLGDGGAHHAANPFVTARGDCQEGVVVFAQDGVDGCQVLLRQFGFHHAGHFGVAFE